MQTRRDFLAKMSATTAGVALPISRASAQGDAATPVLTSISRVATGYSNLNSDLSSAFGQHLLRKYESDFLKFLENFGSVKDTEGLAQAETNASQIEREIVKELIGLWYSGWTGSAPDVPQDVKALAYEEALAWRAAGLSARGLPGPGLWQETKEGRENE